MRLLVTGGAGYIGSIVTATLLASDHEVVVLDDLSTGHRDAVPDGATLVESGVSEAGAVLDGGGFDAVSAYRGEVVGRRVRRAPGVVLVGQRRRIAAPTPGHARGRRATPGLLVHRGDLRDADRVADHREHPGRTGKSIRPVQARSRPHDRRRGAGPRARSGRACATSTSAARRRASASGTTRRRT